MESVNHLQTTLEFLYSVYQNVSVTEAIVNGLGLVTTLFVLYLRNKKKKKEKEEKLSYKLDEYTRREIGCDEEYVVEVSGLVSKNPAKNLLKKDFSDWEMDILKRKASNLDEEFKYLYSFSDKLIKADPGLFKDVISSCGDDLSKFVEKNIDKIPKEDLMWFTHCRSQLIYDRIKKVISVYSKNNRVNRFGKSFVIELCRMEKKLIEQNERLFLLIKENGKCDLEDKNKGTEV